jgi:hypothetical protein
MNDDPDDREDYIQFKTEDAMADVLREESLYYAYSGDELKAIDCPCIALPYEVDFDRLTGVELTDRQIDDLYELLHLTSPGLWFRLDPGAPPAKFHHYAKTSPWPMFAGKEGGRRWARLQRHCAAVGKLLENHEARSAITYALKDLRALPRDHSKSAELMMGLLGHDLDYVLTIIQAISTLPPPTISRAERTARRGELAVAIGEWWEKVTGKSPVNNNRFKEFLREFASMQISDTTLKAYWRDRG